MHVRIWESLDREKGISVETLKLDALAEQRGCGPNFHTRHGSAHFISSSPIYRLDVDSAYRSLLFFSLLNLSFNLGECHYD